MSSPASQSTTVDRDSFRIAILASGEGSNLQALIDAIDEGALPAQIVAVFSDKPQCNALHRARAATIATTALVPSAFASREAFDAALFAEVDETKPDLIVCAGYMRLIDPTQVEFRRNRMINLHPSLLPAFKGLNTHRQALDAGAREHGASVHVVTADLDGGPVIAQARVPVLPSDDVTTLLARVRAREHPLLVNTIRWLAERRLRLLEDGIYLGDSKLLRPLQLAANQLLA